MLYIEHMEQEPERGIPVTSAARVRWLIESGRATRHGFGPSSIPDGGARIRALRVCEVAEIVCWAATDAT